LKFRSNVEKSEQNLTKLNNINNFLEDRINSQYEIEKIDIIGEI
jgi:hypothetical protein